MTAVAAARLHNQGQIGEKLVRRPGGWRPASAIDDLAIIPPDATHVPKLPGPSTRRGPPARIAEPERLPPRLRRVVTRRERRTGDHESYRATRKLPAWFAEETARVIAGAGVRALTLPPRVPTPVSQRLDALVGELQQVVLG